MEKGTTTKVPNTHKTVLQRFFTSFSSNWIRITIKLILLAVVLILIRVGFSYDFGKNLVSFVFFFLFFLFGIVRMRFEMSIVTSVANIKRTRNKVHTIFVSQIGNSEYLLNDFQKKKKTEFSQFTFFFFSILIHCTGAHFSRFYAMIKAACSENDGLSGK